jgi:hypothetical protein
MIRVAAPKVRRHDWGRSVPPAVAGGSVTKLMHSRVMRVDPPTTAGGTDCFPPCFLSFEANA